MQQTKYKGDKVTFDVYMIFLKGVIEQQTLMNKKLSIIFSMHFTNLLKDLLSEFETMASFTSNSIDLLEKAAKAAAKLINLFLLCEPLG